MESVPPYKKTKLESNVQQNPPAGMANQNQKKYTFNATSNRPNQNPTANKGYTGHTTTPQFNKPNNVSNVKSNLVVESHNQAAATDNDEDFLDISDTELIRASQVVESQLKFTNNVHHTTSNALNIFSQFNSNNNDVTISNSQFMNMQGPTPTMVISFFSN